VSRIARVVIPGIPHHVVQRGNRRQKVFFNDEDRAYYLRLLKKYGGQARLAFWAYCLMPNHVHLIAVPQTCDSLAEAMAAANWKYALAINLREDWRGCLWQGRFYSCPLDDPHLIAAARYIERNPVRAGITEHPGDYPWSSARAHIQKIPDTLIVNSMLTEEIEDWASFINHEESDETIKRLRRHLATGRPLGEAGFIEELERMTGRRLKKQKTGPKPRHADPEASRQLKITEFRG
jgi:putative transposase